MTHAFHIGAQNDAIYIIYGRAPALNNDYPVHDADRQRVATVNDGTLAARLVALANASGLHSKAAADVINERFRQINQEGWTPEHDDEHDCGELAAAAMCYAGNASACVVFDRTFPQVPSPWPWESVWWKPSDPRRDLVKAAALIIAEIERLDRHNAATDEAAFGEQGGAQ